MTRCHTAKGFPFLFCLTPIDPLVVFVAQKLLMESSFPSFLFDGNIDLYFQSTMFSKNLILSGILAAGLASADILQHDAIYSLTNPVGISATRNLRTMTKQTAMDATVAKTFQCDNIGNEGTEIVDRGQLLDLDVILTLGTESAQACCNACVNDDLCVAFSFRPLLQLEACVLAGARSGQSGGLLDLVALVDLDIL